MLSSDCHSNHSWVSFSGFSTAYNEIFEQLNTSDKGMKILLNAQLGTCVLFKRLESFIFLWGGGSGKAARHLIYRIIISTLEHTHLPIFKQSLLIKCMTI